MISNFEKKRVALGWSAIHLAERSGVSDVTIRRVEIGDTNTQASVLKSIADCLFGADRSEQAIGEYLDWRACHAEEAG